MRGVKPWQIVVMALGLIAAAALAVYWFAHSSDVPQQANTARLIDIQTGSLFEARYPEKRPVMYPAKNPSTGTETLYPVFKSGDGWTLDKRYIQKVRGEKALKADLLIDQKSGEVRAANQSPISADVFGR